MPDMPYETSKQAKTAARAARSRTAPTTSVKDISRRGLAVLFRKEVLPYTMLLVQDDAMLSMRQFATLT